MKLLAFMQEALAKAADDGRVPRRWELTLPAWHAIGRETGRSDFPYESAAGQEAPAPMFGVRVAIVTGQTIRCYLVVEQEAQQ